MKHRCAHIGGMGIVSPLGAGVSRNRDALAAGCGGIRPLSVFDILHGKALPVGEITELPQAPGIPRTHQLANMAAAEAMRGIDEPPDAVVLGVTTGGMPATEVLLAQAQSDVSNPDFDFESGLTSLNSGLKPGAQILKQHGLTTVAEDIARMYHCKGPVMTVSTACSSGAAAIKLALEMIRKGMARRVLAGGVDALCRLTYYGFLSLQLIDPSGAKPLDKDRRGMSVAEGAAMLLLTAEPSGAGSTAVLGGGLSCDAYHPAAPHPEGRGALAAMQLALADAELDAGDIDYISLHGTGTPDNDRAEARAVSTLFGEHKPPLSSVKGAFGHSLAAAGAIETVVAAVAVQEGLMPANTGCAQPDPDLGLAPLQTPVRGQVSAVLSNSFGFGGNNAALVIGKSARCSGSKAAAACRLPEGLAVAGAACLTGAGGTRETLDRLSEKGDCRGMLSMEAVSANLPARDVRRLKRLPRLALSLAMAAHAASESGRAPDAVFFGTGWGALSETHDFLDRLHTTGGRFPSPTDFVGSVHNAPAGQIALRFNATGPNLTLTGGDVSFEQALSAALLMPSTGDGTLLVAGADEGHAILSPMLDPSVAATAKTGPVSDGGGALILTRPRRNPGQPVVRLLYFASAGPDATAGLAAQLAGKDLDFMLAGLPAAHREAASGQLKELLAASGFNGAVMDYRNVTGEFASASAVATVMAVAFLEQGWMPDTPAGAGTRIREGAGGVVVGLGPLLTAIEVVPG